MTNRHTHCEGIRCRHAASAAQMHGWQLALLLLFWAAVCIGLTLLLVVVAVDGDIAGSLGVLLGWVILLAVPIVFWLQRVAVRKASLIISDRGLYCHPPRRQLVTAALPTGKPWEVRWRDIRRVELIVPLLKMADQSNAHRYRVRVVASGGERDLAPIL